MTATPSGGQQQLEQLVTALASAAALSRADDAPVEGSAAAVAGIDRPTGTVAAAAGVTALFAADGTVLPPGSGQAAPANLRTPFDMASVTKVVTALTAATLIDDGLLDLEAPVAEHIDSPHPALTTRHLLTHTSGLPPVMPLWSLEGAREERLATIGRARLDAEPGAAHAYSCIGFILLGVLMEQITDTPLPVLARHRVLGPAGAHHAAWEPDGSSAGTAAATEYQADPPRGLVRGSTHDETAWSLGRVGNAGVFADLESALALGRVLAGRTDLPQLSPEVRRLLTTDQLPAGVTTGEPWHQGLGLRVGQETASGELQPRVVGHPGFTGTSVHADPSTGVVAVLLTNRVHPVRSRFTVVGSRRALATMAFG